MYRFRLLHLSNFSVDRSTEARSELVERTLELKLGEERFNALTPAQQCNKCTHLFGGCCCHKDLNVVRYGYRAIQRIYSTHNIPSPVLLANKANAAIINLGADDPGDSAAVQNAVESSSAGTITAIGST
jgi:hypothetical protein